MRLLSRCRRYIAGADAALEKLSALADLAQGDRVRHAIMGTGTIMAVDGVKHLYTIAFDGISTPRIMGFKAPLEKLT